MADMFGVAHGVFESTSLTANGEHHEWSLAKISVTVNQCMGDARYRVALYSKISDAYHSA